MLKNTMEISHILFFGQFILTYYYGLLSDKQAIFDYSYEIYDRLASLCLVIVQSIDLFDKRQMANKLF